MRSGNVSPENGIISTPHFAPRLFCLLEEVIEEWRFDRYFQILDGAVNNEMQIFL